METHWIVGIVLDGNHSVIKRTNPCQIKFFRLFTIHFPLLTKSLNLYGQYNNGQVLLYPSICCHGWNLYDGEVFGERVRGREEGQG